MEPCSRWMPSSRSEQGARYERRAARYERRAASDELRARDVHFAGNFAGLTRRASTGSGQKRWAGRLSVRGGGTHLHPQTIARPERPGGRAAASVDQQLVRASTDLGPAIVLHRRGALPAQTRSCDGVVGTDAAETCGKRAGKRELFQCARTLLPAARRPPPAARRPPPAARRPPPAARRPPPVARRPWRLARRARALFLPSQRAPEPRSGAALEVVDDREDGRDHHESECSGGNEAADHRNAHRYAKRGAA